MSKNYILEPTEADFSQAETPYYAVKCSIDDDSFYSNIEVGATLEINGIKFTSVEEIAAYHEWVFSYEDYSVETNAAYLDLNANGVKIFAGGENITGLHEGTMTVSIYTGEDDPEPDPEPTPDDKPADNSLAKNYIFVDHPYNDVEAIDDKLGKCSKGDGGSDVTPDIPTPEPSPSPDPTPAPAAESNVFVIHFEYDTNAVLPIRTVATVSEIKEAMAAGKAIFAPVFLYDDQANAGMYASTNIQLGVGQGNNILTIILGDTPVDFEASSDDDVFTNTGYQGGYL